MLARSSGRARLPGECHLRTHARAEALPAQAQGGGDVAPGRGEEPLNARGQPGGHRIDRAPHFTDARGIDLAEDPVRTHPGQNSVYTKGATPEPPRTARKPTRISTMMIGVSHHFLLWRTNPQNSARGPLCFPSACLLKEFFPGSAMVNSVGSSSRGASSRPDGSNSSEPLDRIAWKADRSGRGALSGRSASLQGSTRARG